MTLQECAELYDISIIYKTKTNSWHWNISNFDKTLFLESEHGFYNPNSIKMELIEFLKDWDGKLE